MGLWLDEVRTLNFSMTSSSCMGLSLLFQLLSGHATIKDKKMNLNLILHKAVTHQPAVNAD